MTLSTRALGIALVVVACVALYGVTHPAQVNTVVEKVGAAAGPERFSECESTNGVTKCWARATAKTSTTTICALRAPVGATSTLVAATVDLTLSSTTASRIHIAKASTAFATTTQIGSTIVLAANEQVTIIASTTAAQEANQVPKFTSGQYLTVGIQGGTGDFSPVGTCQAEWMTVR